VRRPLIYVRADADERAFFRNHNDRWQFDPRTHVDLERADLIIGMDILQGLHMYVSYREHTIYITAANAH
jgi:hypothetical protein